MKRSGINVFFMAIVISMVIFSFISAFFMLRLDLSVLGIFAAIAAFVCIE